MAFSYTPDLGGEVAVATARGTVREDEVAHAVDRAFAAGILRPGLPRITIYGRDVSLRLLTYDVLDRLQKRVLAYERFGGQQPAFQMALVDPSPMHHGLLLLEKAMWDRYGFRHVEVDVFARYQDALDWLDQAMPAQVLKFAAQ